MDGGEFISTSGGVVIICPPDLGLMVGNFLAEGRAYFDEAGKPIALTEGQTSLTGTVTVKECGHPGVTATPTTTAPTA